MAVYNPNGDEVFPIVISSETTRALSVTHASTRAQQSYSIKPNPITHITHFIFARLQIPATLMGLTFFIKIHAVFLKN